MENKLFTFEKSLDKLNLVDVNKFSTTDFKSVNKDIETQLNNFKELLDLDNLTNGLKSAEMVVIAARPSVGKTSLAMNIVENIAFSHKYINNPKNTLVFSLEMSASSLAMRLICGKAKVNMNDLRKGFVAKNYAEKLNEISQQFQQAPIWVDDTSGLSINQIRAKARRVKSRNGWL